MWLAEYRAYFLTATFVFLAFSHWRNWQNRGTTSRWNRLILHGTTVASLGIVAYSFISRAS